MDRNNLADAIRSLAVKGRHFLFAGTHQAAEVTAAMCSLIASSKKNGVDEQLWLTDVPKRNQSHRHKDLYQLLPDNWGYAQTRRLKFVNTLIGQPGVYRADTIIQRMFTISVKTDRMHLR